MGHTFGLRETVSMMVGGIVGGGIIFARESIKDGLRTAKKKL